MTSQQNRTPFFAVDVGNTRTKIAFWRDVSRADAVAPLPDAEFVDASETFEATAAWLEFLSATFDGSARWLVSSVNGGKSAAFEATVRKARPDDSFRLLTRRDVPIPFEYDFPEKLGIDRLVAAFAGTRIFGPNRPFLAVDVGTAATVDFVDANGVFRGGAILPGPRLIAEALRAKTAALPMLSDPEREGTPTPNYPATETQNAIRLGVVFALVGAVSAFYWKTRRKIAESGDDPNRLALVVAGGDAVATERNLRTLFDDLDAKSPEIVVEPRLLSLGIWETARRQSGDFWR